MLGSAVATFRREACGFNSCLSDFVLHPLQELQLSGAGQQLLDMAAAHAPQVGID